MNEILSTAAVLTVLVTAFAGLVAWVRRDTLAVDRRTPVLDVVERDREPVTVRRSSPTVPGQAGPASPARPVRRSRVAQVSGS